MLIVLKLLKQAAVLLMIFSLGIACVFEPAKNTRTKKSTGSGSTVPTAKPTTTPIFDYEAIWYSGGTYQTSIIAPENTASVVYLRGSAIHNFLSALYEKNKYNHEKNYCLVMNFNQSGGTKQYRVRANAINNVTNNGITTERMFKIDLPDGNGNSDICVGSLTSPNRLSTNSPNKLFVDSKGIIYVASNEGLYISVNGGTTFSKKTTSHGLPSNTVYGVYADSNSNVYAATSSGLAISYSGGSSFTKTITSSTSGFASTIVKDVATNSIGTTIFVATGSGLSISTDSGTTFTTKTTANGLGSNYINGLFLNGSTLYAATTGGLAISTNSGTSFSNKTTGSGLGSNTVYRVFAVSTKVYAATANGLSVSSNSGSSFTNRTTLNGLASNTVYGVSATTAGIVYGATTSGLSISYDSGVSFTKTKTTASGLGNNYCKDVALDSAGHLYIATTGGLSITIEDAVYHLNKVCETCSGVIDSTHLSLYESPSNSLSDENLIGEELVPVNKVVFRVNTSTNTTNPSTVGCSDMYCSNLGYDCCVDGQCVFDKTLRPESSLLSSEILAQAQADILSNPQNFINWPNVYYVCGNVTNTTPTPTPTPNASATADAYFEAQKNKYYCMEGGAADTPDYTHCCSAMNSSCTESNYMAISDDVLEECGCEAAKTEDPPYDPATVCPAFGLKVTKDSGDNIIKVMCKIPPVDPNPTPFQNLVVSVSSKSAPHRFYRKDTGESVDDMSTLADTGVEQEGEKFEYMDRRTRLDPISPNFSINTILGSMTIDFTNALPATELDVNYDETYIITATAGFYTPCLNCAPDKWSDGIFSSHPKTERGNGLMSIGHTTARDQFITNYSKGNYEDTIFGRACWIPPTMIPFSHKTNGTLKTQRQNRLTTQAALFMNGYQRDWFGFNKGALIGSFDGVKWFAIGDGRRVTATSTKLYLAINSPFADVAENSVITASVVLDNGHNTASSYDYDFDLDYKRPDQNKAGSCQRHHICETDYDCVSRLGWEYMCADVSPFRTLWPVFDSDGNEQVNQSKSLGTFSLAQFFNSDGGTKRCVYRGAGSVCARNYSSLTNLSDSAKKMFTCAPNFHCESISSSEFNNNINRSINSVEAIQYGQLSPILGRPEFYFKGNANFPSAVTTNINANISNYTSITGMSTTNAGICRPGKSVTSNNALTQHQTSDTRTDYISQIAPCNATATTKSARIMSCPQFETDEDETSFGNYIIKSGVLATTDYNEIGLQNMCGIESRITVDDYPFKDIEAKPAGEVTDIASKMVTRDACIRKAGSICHTNHDCGPNKLHSEEADLYDNDKFGGTDAEHNFWKEYLVCSQEHPAPDLDDDAYDDYDMSLNRCCREVGKTITLYTALSGFTTDDEYGDNPNLNPASFPHDNTTLAGRYSRYSSVAATLVTADPTDTSTPYFSVPQVTKVVTGTGTMAGIKGTLPHLYQWKTINDTGAKTCCGGGWIRNFAKDNNHDWSTKAAPQLIWSKLECLNYSNELTFEVPTGMSDAYEDRFAIEQSRLCRAPSDKITPAIGGSFSSTSVEWTDTSIRKVWKEGGCAQVPIEFPKEYEIAYPYKPAITTRVLDTTPTEVPTSTTPPRSKHHHAPYMPIVFENSSKFITNTGADLYEKQNINFFFDDISAISFYLPIYIDPKTIGNGDVFARIYDPKGNLLKEIALAANTTIAADASGNISYSGLANNTYALVLNSTIMHVKIDPNDPTYDDDGTAKAWTNGGGYGGVVIKYEPFGTEGYLGTSSTSAGLYPGNAIYYATKLSRFELLGVPQIFYEPLTCNSNPTKIVEDIFDLTSDTLANFNANSEIYLRKPLGNIYDPDNDDFTMSNDPANPGNRVVYSDKVKYSKVWKANEFTCCLKLGEQTTDKAKCCSGHAEDSSLKKNSSGTALKICMLPAKTDLSLYFNRFISSEGVGEDQPGGGLEDSDFIPETGEPKLKASVKNKLVKLGESYCKGGKATTGKLSDIKTGASFGKFFGQPNSGKFYPEGEDAEEEDTRIKSVIDSTNDNDSDSETGVTYYDQGYYWNHHYYCPVSTK